jgi:hypothetical protein
VHTPHPNTPVAQACALGDGVARVNVLRGLAEEAAPAEGSECDHVPDPPPLRLAGRMVLG